MTTLAPIVLIGWIPCILLLYALLPARRAMLTAMLGAWMFLPMIGFELPGLPNYTKVTATSLGVLVATVLFDTHRLLVFRPALLDLPMLVWCLCPFASALDNGLGAYDGLSAAVEQSIMWGLPYFLGRIYLRDLASLREVALGLFIGGLVYVPLCLWEVRMSPNLHFFLYGSGASGIEYASELGKWGSRPRVFMGTALAVGLFLTAATLSGLWLWSAAGLKRIGQVPVAPLLGALAVTALLCKNLGALVLLAGGLAVYFVLRRVHTLLPLYAVIAVVPLYMAVRTTGVWDGAALVALAQDVHARRAESLQTRLIMENRLIAKALERPVCGWGRWGRSRVYDEAGKDISLTDGQWVIALGTTGLIGLASLTASIVIPLLAFLRACPRHLRQHPAVAPSLALAVLLGLYLIDNLFNAMLNPIYLVATGGLAAVAQLEFAARRARRWGAPAGMALAS